MATPAHHLLKRLSFLHQMTVSKRIDHNLENSRGERVFNLPICLTSGQDGGVGNMAHLLPQPHQNYTKL